MERPFCRKKWNVDPRARSLGVALLIGAISMIAGGLSPLHAQEGVVRGRVVAEGSLQPIAGAQIVVEELEGVGTLTNANGQFTIPNLTRSQVTLQVQVIGYRTATATADVGGEPIRIALAQAAVALDALVVTGTAGAQQRRSLGNSLGQVEASDIADAAPISNVQDLINSRSPGVNVEQASGTVGTGAHIKIRGQSSLLLGNNPLIYVDGVRVDNSRDQGVVNTSRFEDLNPDEIESIEIIRGPAAATLYGTEAAAGVIQVITKRGAQGAPQFEFTVRQGTQFLQDPGSLYDTRWWTETDGSKISLNLYEREKSLGFDPFTYGHLQSYQGQVTGGTETVRYFFSGGLDRNRGIIESNRQDRYSGRTNISIVPNETLSFDANLGLTVNRLDLVEARGTTRTIGGGLFRGRPFLVDTPSRGWSTLTAQEMMEAYQVYQDTDKFTVSVQSTHQPVGWFEHRLTAGADISSVEHTNYTPLFTDPTLVSRLRGSERDGVIDVTSYNTLNTTVDYGASVLLDVNDAVTLRSSAGMQYYNRRTKELQADGMGFPGPGLSTVGAAAVRSGRSDFLETSTVGLYYQQEVHFNNRIFLTGAVRADDNSAFGEDFSWVIYPKVSASWVISEEPFFGVGWMDQLRLRGAYGASGRQPDAFAALRTFAPQTGTNDDPSVTPNAVGNPDLAPERGEELELGFEAAMFEDRLGLDVTFYNQNTRDVILSRINAPSSGFPGNQFVNAGELLSRGVEFVVTGRPFDNFGVHVQASWNYNEIKDLGGLPPIIRSAHPSGVMDVPGFAPGSHFTKKVVSADFDTNYTAINIMCDGGTGAQGMERGGPAVPCDDAPVTYNGNVVAPWAGSFGFDYSPIENLQIVGNFGFEQGKVKFRQNNWVACTSYRVCRENHFPEEFSPERIAEVERGGSELLMAHFYEDASYIKLREISANFTLPDRWLPGNVDRASFSLGARNLFTWTGFTGPDPETLSTGEELGRIDDMGGIPIPTTFVATLRVGF